MFELNLDALLKLLASSGAAATSGTATSGTAASGAAGLDIQNLVAPAGDKSLLGSKTGINTMLPALTQNFPNPPKSLTGQASSLFENYEKQEKPIFGIPKDKFVRSLGMAAEALSPRDSSGRPGWQGRLGVAAVGMADYDAAEKERTLARGLDKINIMDKYKSKDDLDQARSSIKSILTSPDSEGKSLLESLYPDEQRQKLALDKFELGDMTSVDDILKQPSILMQNKAISDAYASVDQKAPVDSQRNQFIQTFTKLNPTADVKSIVDLSRLIVPEKSKSAFGSSAGRQLEDRMTLVETYGEDSPQVKQFDEFTDKKEHKTISASKIKMSMNQLTKNVMAQSGLMEVELVESPEIQGLLLEAQEMFERGETPTNVWNTIKDQVPKKAEVVEEKPWYSQAYDWMKRELGMEDKPQTPAPPTPKENPDERVRVISPDGKTGSISRKNLNEALSKGYRRVE